MSDGFILDDLKNKPFALAPILPKGKYLAVTMNDDQERIAKKLNDRAQKEMKIELERLPRVLGYTDGVDMDSTACEA